MPHLPRSIRWTLWPPLVILPGDGRHFSEGPETGGSLPEDPGFGPLFEQSSDPMIVLDASHTILDANAAAARFLRTSFDRLDGASVLEVDLLTRLLTAGSIFQKLKTDSLPVTDEVSLSNVEGQAIQCRIEAIPLSESRTLIHISDTTAVLRSKEALEGFERLHQAVFDALPEVVWSMALPEERLLDVSPSVERVFGYQPATFQQHPERWDEIVHPADRERVRAEFRKGLASGRPFEIHFTGLHRDHRDLPHLVNRVIPVPDERGWIERCQGLIEDLSIRHSLEESLRTTEANLRHVLDTVSSGVMAVRPGAEGVEVALCNRHFADLFKLDQPLKPGMSLAAAPPDVRELIAKPDALPEEIQREVLSEETLDEVSELDDPHRVLRRYVGPIRDSYGGVVGRIITVEDVTSSWLLHRRLTHAQKMESMGRLAGGVAHDFNNLLGTVLGFGSLLLEQTPEGDTRREPLLEIVRAADRASRLTAALLTFSRSARFERTPVDLNRVIEDSYQLMRSTLDPSVAIDLRLHLGLPVVYGDALLLQQTVINLVQEAREQLSGGGSLQLRTEVEPAGPVPGAASDAAPRAFVRLEIEVTRPSPADTGARTSTPPEARTEEAGLAFTMAEDIVRAHGGYLVTGSAARPALFRVRLPVEPSAEAPLIVPEAATARGHETILVVDDEPGLRTLAKAGLHQRGFDVITAENGDQALEILRAGQPRIDVVLLDLSMPGLSGERVLRAIRNFRPELPVIIASGYATMESQTAWNAAGAQGFVAKPYRIQDVAQKLREVLDRTHGRVG